MSTRPAAVLWDMDGTIVDTEPYWIATEYALVAEFGGEWDDEKAHSLVGKDLRDSAAIIRDRGGVDLPIDDIVNRLLDGVIEQVRRHVPWRPGAKELLAAVRKAGVPNALVTMSWTRFALAVVEALPPGTFDAVITGDEVSQGKPHPEPYLVAATKLGVHPFDCVAIEDSPTGVRSAVAAGCLVYAVPNVVDIPPSAEYVRIDSLVDLTPERLGLVAVPDGVPRLPDAPRRAPAARPPATSPDGAASGPTTGELPATPEPARRRRRPRRRRWGLAAGGLVVVGGLAAGAVAISREDPPPPFADMAISGWAPYWALPEATASVQSNASVLHEVSPFWFEATAGGTIAVSGNVPLDQLAAFTQAATASGAKVLPSISDGTKQGEMASMLADPARRAAHVDAIVKLVRDNGFDGIDIDYEGFAFTDDRGTWEATRPNWVLFVQDLAAALHAEGKLLSVSVPPIYDTGRTPDSGYWVYDYAAMGDVVDRIRIMAYDYSVEEPGPIAPYEWVRVAVKAAKRAVADDSRVVLGIGLYGRNWVVATSGTCPSTAEGTTAVSLRNVEALAAKRGGSPLHDEATGEASFGYDLEVTDGTTTCTQTRRVHFVDEQGALARVDLAREERIGGVAFWALGFDSEAVWDTVAAVARPQGAPAPAP